MSLSAIDSNVLIAAANKRDQNHDRALSILRGIDNRDLPTSRVTNYVVAEVLNTIHSKHSQQIALNQYDRLKASVGFKIIQCAQKDFTQALELFETSEELSFVDATIATYMDREEIEYLYSFDDDFDVIEGITRLETTDNPFN